MASLCAQKSSVAGLRASAVRPSASRRPVRVCAKYGEESKYFDLKDLENTTGSWDMYGVEEKKRYPALQETFFKQAADILGRREAINAFVALTGAAGILAWGAKGSAIVELPITTGPREGKTENGKGGSVRSRI
ncbi:photosystem I reaction center subunit VI, chloroplast precursor [Haematococcus lacustris]